MTERIAVIGLGYVGLPAALAFADQFADTVGFDINPVRVEELRQGLDRTREVTTEALRATSLHLTTDPHDLAGADVFIFTVPTPITANKQPDLGAIIAASELVGRYLRLGAIAVYESTVYPGVTEEICGPVLARVSGLRCGVDFTLGYSPERTNPGDKEHTFARVIKVVAGQDAATLERLAAIYGRIVPAGIHRAPSIRVAEAAKVIENTQRDLNIALINELAMVFERMGIATADVLAAARTKWNFLPFSPGLVGGHCISVDPYYLTAAAEVLGYHPQVILAGRRINDAMGEYVAHRLVKLLVHLERPVKKARVGVLGITFKGNISDIRNSRVPDIIRELDEFGIRCLVHDPHADPAEVAEEYQIKLVPWERLVGLDAIVLAVAHQEYLALPVDTYLARLRQPGVFFDVKSAFSPGAFPPGTHYASL